MSRQDLVVNLILTIVFVVLGGVMVLSPDTRAEETEKRAEVVVGSDMNVPTRKILHKGRPEDSQVQEYVNYAYEISNGDMDFITTLEAENGLRDPHRRSQVRHGGKQEDSRGFCQLHRNRHRSIVDDKRFRSDRKWQMDRCREKYKGGTTFYGYNHRNTVKDRFEVNKGVGYPEAKKQQEIADQERARAIQMWKLCKDSGECKY